MKIGSKIKLCIFFFLIVMLPSCEGDDRKSIKYDENGNIKQIEYYGDNKKIDSISIYRANGNKLRDIIVLNQNLNFLKNYYATGTIESEGAVLKEYKNGWWNTYTKDGKLRNKYEFKKIGGKEYVNQSITYNSNGRIIKEKSNYFKIYFPDTIGIGKTKIDLFYKPFSDESDIFVCVGYNINDDFSNLVSADIDTFHFKASDPKKWLGLRYLTKGKRTVRGFIYERHLEAKESTKDKDELQLFKTELNLYSEKELIVE